MPLVDKSIAALACAALAACGNYSNNALDDASYYQALPSREDLRYDVPRSPGGAACLLGESTVAGDTRRLGILLALSLDSILGFIDLIRQIPPTSRDGLSRTWGPFPDDKHPGVTVRVIMTRKKDEARFTFALDQRRSGDFLTVLSAEFVGARARNGQGTLRFDWDKLALLGTSKPTDPQQGVEDIAYDLTGDPKTISIAMRGTLSPAAIDVAAWADGQARLTLDFTDASGAHIVATSSFISTGAGKATWSVSKGIFADTVTECWDPLYCRTYIKDPAGWVQPPCTGAFCELGDIAKCPNVH